ncbi:MAG: 50S ribosomal protein L17 [Chitinophagaceae bacterium]|nr:50S ribosomal protein L17 [Chitinophagaceae bacterium]MCW5926511.1 50S ribosomal protein L17 [Chitinophagaceae bacterium]
MRHGDKINNLSRTASHRKALLKNLANALITNKRIVTTLAKAKALRTYVEPLITKTKKADSKEQISHNHRLVFSHLQNKEVVKELFTVVAPKVAGRPGGYTRIIKLGKRVGDNAETALIELVDFNEVYVKGTDKAETTRRTRRGRSKKADAPAKAEETKQEAASPAEEAPAEETKAAE